MHVAQFLAHTKLCHECYHLLLSLLLLLLLKLLRLFSAMNPNCHIIKSRKRFLNKSFKTLFVEMIRNELFTRLTSVVMEKKPIQNGARMSY